MGIPDHLTCLLRNLYAGQEAIVRTEHNIAYQSLQDVGKAVLRGKFIALKMTVLNTMKGLKS